MTGAVWDNLDRVCDVARLIPNFDTSDRREWQRFNINNTEDNFDG